MQTDSAIEPVTDTAPHNAEHRRSSQLVEARSEGDCFGGWMLVAAFGVACLVPLLLALRSAAPSGMGWVFAIAAVGASAALTVIGLSQSWLHLVIGPARAVMSTNRVRAGERFEIILEQQF